ncbi:MAG: TetR family transcriptional regulator [Pseudomonadota bacterium]|nr:TetR family transcriptional regulator [Pseudomonadota bacterium]
MTADRELAQRILDTALELGEHRGWDALHLYEIAETMGMTVADIQRCYPHKDALAEAWFDRAEAALVAMAGTPGWMDLSPRQRLIRTIMSWFDALAAHKGLTAAMLRYKLQPDHVHLQALGLVRVSRTVQWIRETACLPEAGWRRELQEITLTGIYLSTVAHWLRDDSPRATRTRALLDRLLANAERAALQIAPRK